jgi:uroporphyrinogen III methyltransferase / synthase
MEGGPLDRRTIVVTRAAAQAGPFVRELQALGASVLEVPLIEIVDPADGGAALRAAVDSLSTYDWVVLTSPNAAARFVAAHNGEVGPKIGVVGPGTAAVLTDAGCSVTLIADRSVGEGLVEAFPLGPGRVLLPRAAVAREVVPKGLAAKGWAVDEVEAYRTQPVAADPAMGTTIAAADAIVFTSSSTATSFLSSYALATLPALVLSIGPETTATLEAAGATVSATANPHTLHGLVTLLRERLTV